MRPRNTLNPRHKLGGTVREGLQPEQVTGKEAPLCGDSQANLLSDTHLACTGTALILTARWLHTVCGAQPAHQEPVPQSGTTALCVFTCPMQYAHAGTAHQRQRP